VRTSVIVGIVALTAISLWRFRAARRQIGQARRSIVITGSTRGIGFALAKTFLELGDDVVINGKSQASVDKALATLSALSLGGKVYGFAADVTSEDQCELLLEFAASKLGHVCHVIANAGVMVATRNNLWTQPTSEISRVINTNLIGSLVLAKVAINLFITQKSGTFWFMEGAGSTGMITPKYAPYGASKAAIPQVVRTLNSELVHDKHDEIFVCSLSPGMVITDMIKEFATPKTARVFNTLCETPDVVARYLVPRIRTNVSRGTAIRFLSGSSVAWRFATGFTRRDRFFDERSGAPLKTS